MGREEAIAEEQRKTREGNSSKFDYVNTRALERLGIGQYKTQGGSNFIRIIDLHFSKYPPEKKPFYGKPIHIHTHVGADDRTYLCMKKMFGQPCAVCELADRIRAENSSDARLKELSTSPRYLFFVYDTRSADTERKGLQWFDAPVTIKDNIVTLSNDKRTNRSIDVSNREKGMDIEFERVGSGLNTKYQAFKLSVGEVPPKSWYDNAPDDFDEFLLIPRYEDVAAELAQGPTEQDETRGRGESRGGNEVRGETRGEVRGGGSDVVQDPGPEVRSDPTPNNANPSPGTPPAGTPATTQPTEAPQPEVRSRGEAETSQAETRTRGEAVTTNGVSDSVKSRIDQLKNQG